MNPALEFLFRRRSIRSFKKGSPVSEAQIRDILECAMSAPSACGKDPWQFIVLTKRDDIDTLIGFLPNGPFLKDASAAVIVCGDIDRAHAGQLSFLLQDCAAAIENILLALPALGLGGCWVGIHPRGERMVPVSKHYGLTGNIIPVGAVAIGVPDEEKPPRTRFEARKIRFI